MIVVFLILVKILGAKGKIRGVYKRLSRLAAERSVSQDYHLFQVWEV